MDFPKFVSTLLRRKLFFSRVDTLPDPLEGRLPTSMRETSFRADVPKESRRLIAQMDHLIESHARHAFYVNCWHMNEHESVAMWQYGKGEYGIALKSSHGRLRTSFEPESRPVFIGAVEYRCSGWEQPRRMSTRELVLQKEPWWEYERELRAFVQVTREHPAPSAPLPLGVEVDTDLDQLIESIYVAPRTPAWFTGMVESLLEKHGLSRPVVPSLLLRTPAELLGGDEDPGGRAEVGQAKREPCDCGEGRI